jgi:hypothetical protein
MRSAAAVLVLMASVAHATPDAKPPATGAMASRSPTRLVVAMRTTKVVDSANKLAAAEVDKALLAVKTELTACAKDTLQTSATITFEKGTVAKLELGKAADAFGACITPPLRKVTIASAGRVTVAVDVEVMKVLDEVVARDLNDKLDRFRSLEGDRRGDLGYGRGVGTGVGVGTAGTGTKAKGSGGGGKAEGDFVSTGKIDVGAGRSGGKCPGCGPRIEARVAIGEITGSFNGYTAEEVKRVVMSRTGLWRACYQKELNRTPGIAGKLVFHVSISGDGTVGKVNRKLDTMKSAAVEMCVSANLMRLRFPAKGAQADVAVPMIFTIDKP